MVAGDLARDHRSRFVLTFSEEVVLLLLDDEEGIFLSVGKTTLELALTGSVLMELAFSDRIDTDLAGVMVVDRTPTADPILDRVLERIAGGEETRSAKAWIEELAVEETAAIQEHALASLMERGILRREQKKLLQETVQHLWIFRSPRYFMVDEKAKREVKARIDVLFSDEIPDPRDIALICLLDACGILRTGVGGEETERITPRIEQLRKMDLIGREIATAIAQIERLVVQSTAHALA